MRRGKRIEADPWYFPYFHYADAEIRMIELGRRALAGLRIVRPVCRGIDTIKPA